MTMNNNLAQAAAVHFNDQLGSRGTDVPSERGGETKAAAPPSESGKRTLLRRTVEKDAHGLSLPADFDKSSSV